MCPIRRVENSAFNPTVFPADKGLPYPIIADPKREMAYRLGQSNELGARGWWVSRDD